MNILVNGASGYIGYHLIKELLNADYTVYAVCRKSPGLLSEIKTTDKLIIIISSQDELLEKINGLHIDVWFQLLWEGSCGEMRTMPEIQIQNEKMAVQAMETAQLISCKKIIFTGTVYERFYSSIVEDTAFNRHSFYIMSKYHAHNLTLQLSKKMKIKYIWVQFCHPVGQYMNKNQLIPYAVNAFKNNYETEFGPCNNFFDVFSVNDLAKALTLLAQRDAKKNFYYIGSGSPQRLSEYIETAAKINNYNLPIGFNKRPDDKLCFEKNWFDASDFINEFGWKQEYTYETSIKTIFSGDTDE